MLYNHIGCAVVGSPVKQALYSTFWCVLHLAATFFHKVIAGAYFESVGYTLHANFFWALREITACCISHLFETLGMLWLITESLWHCR